MQKKEPTYNEAIAEIEAIINKIESAELNVDELDKDVKRASELIELCKAKLHTTEDKIDKILEKIDN